MENNVGKTDQMIRYALAVPFAALALWVNPLFWIVSVVLLITAGMKFCGIYKLLGINTCKIHQHQ